MENEQDSTQQQPVENQPPTPNLEPQPAPEKAKKPWYRNMLLVGPLVVLVVAILAIGIVGLTSSDETDNPQADSQAETPNLASAISLVEGTVEYSTDNSNWQTASGGETVNVGDYVRTSDKSRTVVLLDDGSAVRLDQNSHIRLMTADQSASEVMLLKGQVYSRVVESETRTFAVVTDKERFQAMGTAYKTRTETAKDSLEVYQSTVMVESDATEVEEGNQYDTDQKEKTSIDLDKLKDDDFVQWNKQRDSSDEKYKDKLGVLDIDEKDQDEDDDKDQDDSSGQPEPAPAPGAQLTLTGSKVANGVSLSWTNTGISANEGYKVVFDKSDTTPTYKENSSHYLGAGNTSYVVPLEDGKTYSFRVCAYRSAAGSCVSYSNTVTVTAPLVEKEAVEAGTVTLEIEDDTISWGFTGTAPHGFKVLLNTEGNPTYPANSIKYLGSGQTSYELPEKPAGTYFVRVCKYTADSNVSGGCTDYSNQVEYEVDD